MPDKAWFGFILISASTLLYGILQPLFKKGNQTFPPFTVIAISMFILFITSVVLSFVFEKGISWKLISENRNTVLVLLTAGFLNTIGFWLAIQTYKYMPLWQQSLFGLFIPILTGIFAYFLLGEVLNPKLFIGLTIMAIGLFVAIR